MMAGTAVDPSFWRGKSVFLTGHTGFKGGWLAHWLADMGSSVTGYSLAPPVGPSLFASANVAGAVAVHHERDIRDADTLRAAIRAAHPDVVLHLAAQTLVRPSYSTPAETFATNVTGTVNVLEAVRAVSGCSATLIVTTDKCYENREQIWGYREDDPKGGHDPYSASKACAELVVSCYGRSFFTASSGLGGLGSARAGNVVAGGDWSVDRLVPDMIRGLATGRTPVVRRPRSTRPWQHVLDCLSGYLVAVQHMARPEFASPDAWNFGPDADSEMDALHVANRVCELWGEGVWPVVREDPGAVHEAGVLSLDSTKVRHQLGWRPRWTLERALQATVDWYIADLRGADMGAFTQTQIRFYMSGGSPVPLPSISGGEGLEMNFRRTVST